MPKEQNSFISPFLNIVNKLPVPSQYTSTQKYIVIYHWQGGCRSISTDTTWYIPNSVKVGPVFLEKKMLTDDTRQTQTHTNRSHERFM